MQPWREEMGMGFRKGQKQWPWEVGAGAVFLSKKAAGRRLLDHCPDFRLYPEGYEKSLKVFQGRSSVIRLGVLEQVLWLKSGGLVGRDRVSRGQCRWAM
jgi:hypothetical protein